MSIDGQTVLVVNVMMGTILVLIWISAGFYFKLSPQISLQYVWANVYISIFMLLYVIRHDLLTYIFTDISFVLGCFYIRRSTQALTETTYSYVKDLIFLASILTVDIPTKFYAFDNKVSVVCVCGFALYCLISASINAYSYLIKDFNKQFSLSVLFPIYSIALFTFLRIIETVFSGSYSIDLRKPNSFNGLLLICMLISLLGFNGVAIGLVIAKMIKKIRILSQTDSLTHVFNRTHFSQLAEKDLENSYQHQSSFSVIMLDIDHFKKINDTYGHATGDCVLVSCVNTIRQYIRSSDYIGRLGGEEFGIVLPNTNIEEAKNIAENLRYRISQEKIKYNNLEISITASLGIHSNSHTQHKSLSEILNGADQAMYFSKKTGRNKVSF